jgi:hypothetical protein
MRKFLIDTGDYAVAFGVISLIPMDFEGTMMWPLWLSLGLIAAGVSSRALFFVRDRVLD